ncbi:MAG: hypothetical protein K8R60_15800 [Burkholderiales bacterium]|nr:hypothetical protein [Burkholderiales bacterium]
MSNLKTLVVGASLTLAALGAFAQAATAATPKADAREVKQQARIDAGVASGQLNAKETNRLEKQQGHVAAVEAKAKADGTVTKAERHHLNKVQNRTSENIKQQKHDAQTAPAAAKP